MAIKIKNAKLLSIPALLALLCVPIATASANTVQIKVEVNPVADVEVVSEQRGNETKYTATVKTNSVNGFDVLVSSDNGKTYEFLKSVDDFIEGEPRIVTATSDSNSLKFKVVPHQ